MNTAKDTRLQIMTPQSLVQAIDAWRIAQPDRPTRSEAVRRMIARCLEQDTQK